MTKPLTQKEQVAVNVCNVCYQLNCAVGGVFEALDMAGDCASLA